MDDRGLVRGTGLVQSLALPQASSTWERSDALRRKARPSLKIQDAARSLSKNRARVMVNRWRPIRVNHLIGKIRQFSGKIKWNHLNVHWFSGHPFVVYLFIQFIASRMALTSKRITRILSIRSLMSIHTSPRSVGRRRRMAVLDVRPEVVGAREASVRRAVRALERPVAGVAAVVPESLSMLVFWRQVKYVVFWSCFRGDGRYHFCSWWDSMIY